MQSHKIMTPESIKQHEHKLNRKQRRTQERKIKYAQKKADKEKNQGLRGDEIMVVNTGIPTELCLAITNRGATFIQQGHAFAVDIINGEKKMTIKVIGQIQLDALLLKQAEQREAFEAADKKRKEESDKKVEQKIETNEK